MARESFEAKLFTDPIEVTGIVNAVNDFAPDLAPGQPRPQAHDESTGLPLWEVEITRVVENFGRRETRMSQVRVPAPVQPVVPEGLARFDGLRVSCGTNRAGTLTTFWNADAVKPVEKPARDAKGVS